MTQQQQNYYYVFLGTLNRIHVTNGKRIHVCYSLSHVIDVLNTWSVTGVTVERAVSVYKDVGNDTLVLEDMTAIAKAYTIQRTTLLDHSETGWTFIDRPATLNKQEIWDKIL